MDNHTLGLENSTRVNELLGLDLELLIEQIWNDLQGTVKRSTIRQELGEVIPAFASARIKTYVPIFVRRNTVRRLRVAAAQAPSRHSVARPVALWQAQDQDGIVASMEIEDERGGRTVVTLA